MAVFIGLVVLVLLAALAAILLKARSPQPSHIRSKAILTPNELEFFHRLQRALPDLHVFPQVAANALLEVERGGSYSKRTSARNRFAQKHVDYVLCDRETLRVVSIVELDDRTHKADKDKGRDAMFAGAGYVVHRFRSKSKPSEKEIAEIVLCGGSRTASVPALELASSDQF